MRAKSFEQFINEGVLNEGREQVKTKDGNVYDILLIKNKYSDRQNPTWHMVAKDKKNKTIFGWRDFFWYHQGWSQGMGRSELGYYLNMKGYGSVGNGSGISRPSTPYLDHYMLDSIAELLSGKHYSKERQQEFDNERYTFEWGDKNSDFNNAMD